MSKSARRIGRADFMLFSETQGRIVATIAPGNKTVFEKILKNVPFERIGKVGKTKTVSVTAGKHRIRTPLSVLTAAYRKRFTDW